MEINNTITPSNVVLSDLKQQTYLLSDLLKENKVNLLLFYHTDCLGCTGRAIPFGYELAQKNTDINLVVIHADFKNRKRSIEEILDIFTAKEAPFPIFLDENAELYTTLHCEGTPHWIILNSEGEILHSIFGSQEGAQMKIHYSVDEQLGK